MATRILLFLSSYAPLLVILGIRNSFGHRAASYALFGLAAVSILVLLAYLALSSRLAAHEVTIQSSSSRDGEAMSYIVTYLLPFIGLDSATRTDRISLGVFLAVLAVLYVSTHLIHMNPVLNPIGQRILETDSADGKRSILIARRRYIRPGTAIAAISQADTILLEKK